MKNILVTGGAGYIGSHVVVELAPAGFRPVIIDNLSNSDVNNIEQIDDEQIDELLGKNVRFYRADYQDEYELYETLVQEHIDGVIHLAAFKSVGESVEKPLEYYENNVTGFITLLGTLLEQGVNDFVFSSSAAVYGNPPAGRITEDTPCAPESPYGWTKYMDEVILRDACVANPQLKGVALRYFNVVGSHESGIIGETPKGRPENLLPIIVRATAENKPLTVFGNDYPTPDGTCQRDYIHVVDLAKAHVAAIRKLLDENKVGYEVYNLGTGKPTSVLELINTFQEVNGVKVPYEIGPRRAGDPVASYAAADKANRELGWHATHTIDDAVRSAWHWQIR